MPMVYFKENYNFPRFQRGLNIFPGGGGGSSFFYGGGAGSDCLFPIESHITCVFPGGSGSDCLFPIESHITCVFPGGSGPLAPPPPPSGSVHAIFCCEKVNYEKKLSILTPSPGYS